MPSAVRPDPPIFWIIAGPNGSGKSSFYSDAVFLEQQGSVWIINPDLLALRIQQTEGIDIDAANLESVKRIECWLDASIKAHQTVGVETVLSTGKYRRLVRDAQRRGFQVYLAYFILDDVARNIERVRGRVLKGGHDVPEDRIRARYIKSLRQLRWFLSHADRAWMFDNSGAEPKLIGVKYSDTIKLDENALPQIAAVIRRLETSR